MSETFANTDVPDNLSTIEVTEIRKGLESNKDCQTPLLFKAKIIPYDKSENSNAPVLAISGDDIHLIFSIPKTCFRNLAVAVIDHLKPSDSKDSKPTEKPSDSKDSKPTEKPSSSTFSSNIKSSNKSFKSRLSDVVKNLEGDNTKDIINAYEEDSNGSQKSEKDEEQKITEIMDAVNETEHEPREDSGSSKSEIGENAQENIEESKTKIHEIHATDGERNIQASEDENVIPEEFNLSEHSLNLSYEDCPELKTAWPQISPFTETEDIPIKELMSDNKNGVVTKFLKLEVPNEFIVIKVTSDIPVEAVKYKRAKSDEKIEKSEVSNIGDKSKLDQTQEGKKRIVCRLCNDPEFAANYHKEFKSKDFDYLIKNCNKNELDDSVAGVTPMERIKYAMKRFVENLEAEQQKARTTTTKILLDEAGDGGNLLKGSDNSSNQECLEETKPRNVSDNSDSCDSKAIEKCENKSVKNALNAEKECVSSDSKDQLSFKSEIIDSSSVKHESGKINENIAETAMSSPKYENLKDENSFKDASISSEETSTGRKSLTPSTRDKNDSFEDSALSKDLNVPENEVLKDSNLMENVEGCKETHSLEKAESVSSNLKHVEIETSDDKNLNIVSKAAHAQSDHFEEDIDESKCQEKTVESGELKTEDVIEGNLEESMSKKLFDVHSVETLKNKSNIDIKESDEKLDNSSEKVSDVKRVEDKCEKLDETQIAKASDASLSSSTENKTKFKTESNDEINLESENNAELITDRSVEVVLNETSGLVESESSIEAHAESSESATLEKSECIEDKISEIADTEDKLLGSSFASNKDSFKDTTAEANIESASESDDVKSIASESDDSKDNEKQTLTHKGNSKRSKHEADEVDCAPTRVRAKKIASVISKDAIPENTELKDAKTSSSRGLALNLPSKNSGRTSPIGRSLRSKSLDPTPQTSKGIIHDKKHSNIVESEEVNRKMRSKTPDVVSKKDLKTTARSSPRKLARSSATTESSSTSKASNVQSEKNTADNQSKSRANLDSSLSSSKRNKRGSKD